MGKFTLADLEKRVHERAKASAAESYTRALIEKGIAHCAKKLGEEAIETGLAAVQEDNNRLTAEAADLLYHLLVLLEARGVTLADVEAALRRFEADRLPSGARIIQRARHLGAYLQTKFRSEEERRLAERHRTPEAVMAETALLDFLYAE